MSATSVSASFDDHDEILGEIYTLVSIYTRTNGHDLCAMLSCMIFAFARETILGGIPEALMLGVIACAAAGAKEAGTDALKAEGIK